MDLQQHLQHCPKCKEVQAGYQYIYADIRKLEASYNLPDILPYLLQIREQQVLQEKKLAAEKIPILQRIRFRVQDLLLSRFSLLLHSASRLVIKILQREGSLDRDLSIVESGNPSHEKKIDVVSNTNLPSEEESLRGSGNISADGVDGMKIASADTSWWSLDAYSGGEFSARGGRSSVSAARVKLVRLNVSEGNEVQRLPGSYHMCKVTDIDTFALFKQYLSNRYRLIFDLGRGPYSLVCLARDTARKGKIIVVKLFYHISFFSSQREEFRQYARSLQHLEHPNILPIVDVKEDTLSRPYVVMDYAPNSSLRKRLTSSMRIGTSLDVLLQIGSALQYAHKHHILHRNLKPENVLLNEKDEVLLSDFSTDETAWLRLRSRTLDYLAPEQFEGPASEKSDQYALACIAYELLTGRPPFTISRDARGGVQQRPDQPFPLTQINSSVPPIAEQVINTALAKNPADRHPDIQTFLMKLLAGIWEALQREDEFSSGPHIVTTPLSAEAKAVSLGNQFKDKETPLPESSWDGPITQPLPRSSQHDPVTSSLPKVGSSPIAPIARPVWEQQFTYPVSGPNERFPSTEQIPSLASTALDSMNKTQESTEAIPDALCVDDVIREHTRKYHVVPRYLYVSPELWKDIEEVNGGVFNDPNRLPHAQESKDERI
jgi:serine/threonine protein kinase